MTGVSHGNEVHAHNDFFKVASRNRFGVLPINLNDPYSSGLSDRVILEILQEAFKTQYSTFSALNALEAEVRSALMPFGYLGPNHTGNGYVTSQLENFIGFFNKLFPERSMLVENLAQLHDETFLIVDISWPLIRKFLYEQLVSEKLITLSSHDEMFLGGLFNDELPHDEFKSLLSLDQSRYLWSLFESGHALHQGLTFFQHWPNDKKKELIEAYLRQAPDKSARNRAASELIASGDETMINGLIPPEYYAAFFSYRNARDETYIRRAIKQGSTDKLSALLSKLGDLSEEQQVGYLTEAGNDAHKRNDLMVATKQSSLEAFNLLMQHLRTLNKDSQKAILNHRSELGSDVLMFAAQSQPTAIEPIINMMKNIFTTEEYKAAISRPNKDGNNALMYANSPESVSSILKVIAEFDTGTQAQMLTQKNSRTGNNVLFSSRENTAPLLVKAIMTLEPDQQRTILSEKNAKGECLLSHCPIIYILELLMKKNQEGVSLIESLDDDQKASLLRNKDDILSLPQVNESYGDDGVKLILKALPYTPDRYMKALLSLPIHKKEESNQFITWYLAASQTPQEKASVSWPLLDHSEAFLEHIKRPPANSSKETDKLVQSIDRLRVRAHELIILSLRAKEVPPHGSRYIEAQAAFELYNDLNGTYLDQPDKAIMSATMIAAIREREPILKKDRVFRRIAYDILNALLIIGCVAQYAITGKFGLFDAKTASAAVVEDIEKNIGSDLTSRHQGRQ